MKKNKKKLLFKLPLTLSLITFIIVSASYLIFGQKGIFYALDPDIVYFSNAISWIKAHQIHYIDHPGTPAIWLLGQSFLSLRVYAKIILKQPFVSWAVTNLPFMYTYARIVNSLILSLGTFIFLKAVQFSTKSSLLTILSWLIISSFTPFFFLGSSISPEATSFLLISIWICQFTSFEKSPRFSKLLFLSLISGLSIANKFSNFFLAPITVILAYQYYLNQEDKKPLAFSLATATLILPGFILGTWPIRSRYPVLFDWVKRLATSSGLHGTGQKVIFSLSDYQQSFASFVGLEKGIIILLLLVFSAFFLSLILRISYFSKSKMVLFMGACVGFLVFIKYPLSHYQLANFSLIVFTVTSSISRKNSLALGLILISLLTFSSNLLRYQALVSSAVQKTIILEEYISQHPSQQATVWEWGRSHDFALLWGRAWSAGAYDQELTQYKPDLFELKSDFEKINTNYHDQSPVFEACWDQLYIQKESARIFLEKYKNHPLEFISIEGTGNMGIINSEHCSSK